MEPETLLGLAKDRGLLLLRLPPLPGPLPPARPREPPRPLAPPQLLRVSLPTILQVEILASASDPRCVDGHLP